VCVKFTFDETMKLYYSYAALVLPPDTAAILGHAVDDLLGTLDGFELDDGVVAEAQLLHVTLNLRHKCSNKFSFRGKYQETY